MTFSQWVGDRIPTLLRPSILLSISLYHFIMTIVEIVFLEWRPWKLFDLTSVRFRSFARLWKANGELMSAEMPGNTFQLLSECKGVILDIGPGSGEMLSHFNPNTITALYGAEPAQDLHPGLVKNAAKRGLKDRFHPLVCGAEPNTLIPALNKSGILKVTSRGGTAENGVFDEICCTRVLCSVPNPRQTIKSLYQLLKPGGRMVICEHVANPWRTEGTLAARFMQLVYTLLGWPFFMGGCELQRHTREYLRDAGEWDQFDLKYYGPRDAVPFVVGELIKKHAPMDKSYAEAIKK
ncbi:S-adenosyl-L-methionine-dependent methyltransferase [Ophiobolus disseminans]|uniref:S-adenosyl-L-methionine-dependent methyltransferase n=1 Tax=Ophiobolus disseminans TaxID=1469910 RepID=A0A6A7AB01_9PLEO|nr:S-adenosyl-L-methionine-dependent methyltransferase [Ophiobolus disseminans]